MITSAVATSPRSPQTQGPAAAPAGAMFVPVCEPVLNGREREYVLACLDSNEISSRGRFVTAFEESFAQYCDAKHGVACANGTVALHLALETVGIGPGDEVIIPAFTLIASANMVALTGATPVLVDVDPETWCIDPSHVEGRITPRTKAIMVVHMYGHPVDMDPVLEIARRHGLCVIEDGAQAHGAIYKGRKIGGIGHIGCFSFYGNKVLTTGEGGMLVTQDAKLAQRAAMLRDQAFEAVRFVHRFVGFNYRLTNLQAAIGLAQTETAEDKVARKREIAAIYTDLLDSIDELQLPVERPWARNVFWMYGIVLKESFGRDSADLRSHLHSSGVDTRGFFVPMNDQPVYQGNHPRWPDLRGRYPVSEHISRFGLYLPSGLGVTDEEQKYVVRKLLQARK